MILYREPMKYLGEYQAGDEIEITVKTENVGVGKDYTLFALIEGKVKFEHKSKTQKKVSVYAK